MSSRHGNQSARKRKTPQRKKAESYLFDTRTSAGENQKAHRNNWPLKKARSVRKVRRQSQTLVRAVEHVVDPVLDDLASDVRNVRDPEKPRKFGVMKLIDFVQQQKQDRIKRTGKKKARTYLK